MPEPVVKRNPEAPAGFFEAEAAGLSWLADAGGVRVVRVLEVDSEWIRLERIETGRPSADVARRFGQDLAATHLAGAASWGSPPPGAPAELFIGRRTLPTTLPPTTGWGEFYSRDRVLPYVDAAVTAGFLDVDGAAVVRRACAVISSGDFDDDSPPSRIHGDLWNGNVLWTSSEAVLIDPAAHGGHHETDLAMLSLFGCPEWNAVLDGYESRRPLRPGWRDRVPIHQLHPLAVHAAGHGPAYGVALVEAARATLRLG